MNDGRQIPQLGFGLSVSPQQAVSTVGDGLSAGYRLIDTAAGYRTETSVRQALSQSGCAREEVFITTKLSHHGRAAALRSIERSLARLGTDYLDLYLIHYPFPAQNRYVETWKALSELRADGRARSIGVSNFGIDQLERIIDATGVVPAINQVELHPRFQQGALRGFHSELGIVTEAYSPLGQGTALGDPKIRKLASIYKRLPAQIVLRWHVQIGNVAIPRSVNPSRLGENFRVFDFELEEKDMRSIAALDDGRPLGQDAAKLPGPTGIRLVVLELAERYPAIDPLIRAAKSAVARVPGPRLGRLQRQASLEVRSRISPWNARP